jgi:MFS family permease
MFTMTRTERTYYLVFGAYTFSSFFIGPIYPLYLLSRGVDLFQANAVLAVYLITVFVFEIPTGAVADRFGRKTSFLLSCVVRMAAYGLYTVADGFIDCLVAEFVDAIGTTLASGALEAWAVDGARAEGDRRPADRMLARGQVVSRAGMLVGGILCGYLAEGGLVLPWLVCAAGFGVTAIVGALTMREAPAAHAHTGTSRFSLARTMAVGLKGVAHAPVLRLLCVLALVDAFALMPFYILWQPHLQTAFGQELSTIGWVWAFFNMAALAGSAAVPWLLRRFARAPVLAGAALWRGAMLAIAAVAAGFPLLVAGLVLKQISTGLSEPIFAGWANEHARSEERATMLSVRSAFFTLGGAGGLLLIGLVAREAGIPLAWGLSAFLLAAVAPGFLLAGRVARHTSARDAHEGPAERAA